MICEKCKKEISDRIYPMHIKICNIKEDKQENEDTSKTKSKKTNKKKEE